MSDDVDDRVQPVRVGWSGRRLVSVLVVLALVLFVVLYRPVRVALKQRTEVVAATELGSLKSMAERFYVANGRFPTEEEGLGILQTPLPGGRLVSPESLIDPWGSQYLYWCGTNGMPEIYTLGADRKPGGTGFDRDMAVCPVPGSTPLGVQVPLTIATQTSGR